MRKMVKRLVEQECVAEIACDFCHKVISDVDDRHPDSISSVGGGEVNIEFGYGSQHDSLVEGVVELDICDKCYEERILPYVPKKVPQSRKK